MAKARRSLLLVTVLALRFFCQPSPADDISGGACGEASWSWTPEEWTYHETGHDTRGYAARPDERTLNAITVEWSKPKIDDLGNFCTLSGKLSVPDDGANGVRPVNWLQGVTIYVGIVPDAKPDWTKGMRQENSVHNTTILKQNGEFQCRIDMRRTQKDRDREQRFQVGIALARHIETGESRQKIVWNSRSPVIPATLAMLPVPAAPELSRELNLINRACHWPFSNPDGVELIRIVNALQVLGKDQALAKLEQFLQLSRGFDYHSEREIVFWIVTLLFQPTESGERRRPPAIAVFLDDRNVAEPDKWPLNPMALVNDVPFMVGHRINMSGSPTPPSSYVEWARQSAVIRDKPLEPSTDPITAAEDLFRDSKFKALDEYSRNEAIRSIRTQALTMAGTPPLLQAEGPRLPGFYDALDDRNWKSAVRRARQDKLHWDKARQRFDDYGQTK